MGFRRSGNAASRRRFRAALLTGAMAAGPLYLSTGPARSADTVSRFTPAADAFVKKSRPGANFGTRSVLKSNSSPAVRSYLRFKVVDLAGEVTRATLRVLPTTSDAAGVTVHPVSGPWGEKKITWSNAPAPDAAVASSGALAAGTWASIDVTSLVTGNGAVNLVLAGSSGGATFPSRESSSKRPKLLVETAGSTTTTTTTPTTAPPTPTGDAELPTGCNAKLTVRQATANVLGYLFGDGHFGSNGYGFRARTTCRLTRMKTDLETIGVRYTLSSNKFRIAPVYPFDKSQEMGASPWMDTASADEIKSFLAAVLEGEGSGSGKVLDDPGWFRTAAIVDLYKRVNVVVKPDHAPPACGCETDGTYWNTYVDPSASKAVYNGYIDIIRSFPMAEWGRVPKYR